MQSIRSIIWNLVTIVAVFAAMVTGVPAQAANITGATVVPSTLQAGQSADYTVSFTTPSGASEGSTFSVEYSSEYSLSSLTVSEIDITDDASELTLASDCSGTEQLGVSLTSTTATVTVCSGDGGAIVAGSEVVIEMGSHASHQATGSNQVTNPTSAGTYFVSVLGSFGDSGSMAIPIGSDDTIPVSGTVPSGNDPDPDPDPYDPPPADTTAPSITNIVVSDLTAASATISWETNEAANGQVDYGTSSSLSEGTVLAGSYKTSQSVTLSGLSEGEEYFFKITAEDGDGNSGSSSIQTFDTLDQTAPTISAIDVVEITKTSARVIWETNENASSLVEYGEDALNHQQSDSAFKTEHSILLSGLQAGSTYEFQVVSADESGNETISDARSFETLFDPAPANVSNLEATPGTLKITLSWINPEAEDLAGVRVLACTDTYPDHPTDVDCVQLLDGLSESVTHSELQEQPYYYGVFAYDEAGQFASGAIVNATPNGAPDDDPEDDPAPASVSNLIVAPGVGQNTLTWENPTDTDLDGIRVVVCDDRFPNGPNDSGCQQLAEDMRESYVHAGLQTRPYYYGVYAFDQAGQFAPGAIGTGTPTAPDEEPPDQVDDDPKTTEECGNAICESGETQISCPVDCSDEPTDFGETDTNTFQLSDVQFLVAEQSIELTPMRSNVIDVLGDTVLHIRVPSDVLSTETTRLQLTMGSDQYLLRPSDEADPESPHVLDLITPAQPQTMLMRLEAFEQDELQTTVSSLLNVRAPGYVYEDIDGEEVSVSDVVATVLIQGDGSFSPWDGSPYGQFNPQITSEDGRVQWYVPNGSYRVRTTRDQFRSNITETMIVSSAILTPAIQMIRADQDEEPVNEEPSEQPGTTSPDEDKDDTSFITDSPRQVTDQVGTIVNAIRDQELVKQFNERLDAVRQQPGVQTTARISVPTLAASAGVSVVIMAFAFDLLPFLQYLFTAPLLFFGRRKRKGYGTIYNSITKVPVDLATVRLFSVNPEQPDARGRLVSSQVTDREGRYSFLAQPGTYRIEVFKNGYTFPTTYAADKREDGPYLDVYHGNLLTVDQDDAVLTPNIPLDPEEQSITSEPAEVRRTRYLRLLQKGLAVVGVIASIVFAILRPSGAAFTIVGVQLIMYLLTRRLAQPRKPKSWGIVYDKETGRPLSDVVARIFEPTYNKLLETTVTDSKGRYAVLLGQNKYYAVFDKDGYRPTRIDPIDYSDAEDPQDFAETVRLYPKEDGPPRSEAESPESIN